MPQVQDNSGLTPRLTMKTMSVVVRMTRYLLLYGTASDCKVLLERPEQLLECTQSINASFLKANAVDTCSNPTKCPSWVHTAGQCVQHASLCCFGIAFPRSTWNDDKSWDLSQLFVSQVYEGEWVWAQGIEDKGVSLHSTREDSG